MSIPAESAVLLLFYSCGGGEPAALAPALSLSSSPARPPAALWLTRNRPDGRTDGRANHSVSERTSPVSQCTAAVIFALRRACPGKTLDARLDSTSRRLKLWNSAVVSYTWTDSLGLYPVATDAILLCSAGRRCSLAYADGGPYCAPQSSCVR